jgi:hypothetical protein
MRSALGADKALAEIQVHETNGFASFTRVPVGKVRLLGRRAAPE